MMRIPWASLLFMALLGVSSAPGADGPKKNAAEEAAIPVRFFRVSDDDGRRETAVDVDELRRQVDFMNKAFNPARVRFTFDAAHDLAPLKSTIVNNMLGTDDANWLKAKGEGNRIAAGARGKLVVFLRHGPGARPAGGSFSWFDYNFIAFAAGTDRYWNLAHEAAHYFGLAHPHSGPEFNTLKEAEAFFIKNGKRPEIFDGDGLKDTPPCPGIVALYNGSERAVTLAGHRFTILRGNVVSYYGSLQFMLDGRPLPHTFDGYAPSAIPSGPIELGDFDLQAGLHQFAVKIVGKAPGANGHNFGLDCLQLSAIPKKEK
jgi:hypothetical protein